MKLNSLKNRLLLLLLGSVTALMIAFGMVIREEARHEAEEIFDANLVQTSKLLLTLIEGELSEATQHRWHLITPYQLDEIAQQFHHYEHKIAFQITDRKGNLLIKSVHAPQQLLSTEHKTFQNRLIGDTVWRTFSLVHPQAVIHVGERIELREEVAEEITEHLTEYAFYTLPLLALLIWWSIHQGLRPISAITNHLAKRDSHHLDQISLKQSPKELTPLVEALNQLFSRLQHSMEKERRFTADAAHELRTPLAGIKTQAQVALNETDQEKRRHALQQIIGGVDRTTHLAEQLLSLARIDALNELTGKQVQVDLGQLVTETVEMLSHRADRLQVNLLWDPPQKNLFVDGHAELLSILIRNLIDNGIRYTPRGGSVEIIFSITPWQLLMIVQDSGPGIPSEKQQHIFERFVRDSHTTSGSGLGLSIVQQIAELHHATVILNNRDDAQGLKVSVAFHSHSNSSKTR